MKAGAVSGKDKTQRERKGERMMAERGIQKANVVEMLLNDKRSLATKRAYRADLEDFFGEATPEKVEAFLSLATVEMNYQEIIRISWKSIALVLCCRG
ncbi:MAG: hypothetical protein EOM68_07565, partial [Spirochaetia bacterium]|nr:hypothetical protein [Spirochaetia bacterium]